MEEKSKTALPPLVWGKKHVREHNPSLFSGLVGPIVEKGFSSSSDLTPLRPPQPTTLPFPVARHRSDGPNWQPAGSVVVGKECAEDDMDGTDYDPIASHAKPPKRKERKGIDFSRWKELMDGGTPKEDDMNVGKTTDGSSNDVKKDDLVALVQQRNVVGGTNQAPPSEEKENDVGILQSGKLESSLLVPCSRTEVDDVIAAASLGSVAARMEVDEVGALSLADEIDLENRSRVGQMSKEEIVEAQAEIMERMSPAILDMLRNRARNKMEGRKSASISSMVKVEDSAGGVGVGSEVCDEELKGSTQVVDLKGSGTRESQPFGVHDSTAWRSWSKRVEMVRELRFSCDGNVLPSTGSDKLINGSQYTPENAAERDFLRTEGDPGAAGYTIKEATSLVRSMVPAQRSFALHLLASIFDKALINLHQHDGRHILEGIGATEDLTDWQAIWAYALGPETEIALVLRIALDDNHNTVILACSRVIQSLLCCNLNETFFNISEQSYIHGKQTFTAPVFRSKSEIGCGYLQGGFWKYNTKPSNVLPTDNDEEDEVQEKRTIQDDVIVAGQDFAAGLVRMGVLPRICYLLEMDPSPPLDDILLSILVALARHSPTCSNAVKKCPRLVQTVIDRFTKFSSLDNIPYQIKVIMLLKVLSEADRQHCLDFINRGIFQRTMSHLYRNALLLNDSVSSGKEQCKLTSALMVQQLRFWKVCIRYGYCLSYFSDFFTAMCFWLSPPTFSMLIENDILGEYVSVTTEAFYVLEALAQRLPRVHSLDSEKRESSDSGEETWSWSHVVPMVEIALKWLHFQNNSDLASFFWKRMIGKEGHAPIVYVCWVISAVMHMLSSVINRISPEPASDMGDCGALPWLPDFVPKVGLTIIKNGFLKFPDSSSWSAEGQYAIDSSLAEHLCQLRHGNVSEASLASSCCLHGLIELVVSIDNSVQRAKASTYHRPMERHVLSVEDNILFVGIAKSCQDSLVKVLDSFTNVVGLKWQAFQNIEMFGRGGPAPGVGLGWGSSGGGFWSITTIQAQVDASLLHSLYKIFPIVNNNDVSNNTIHLSCWPSNCSFTILQKINSVIWTCLVAGPSNRAIMERALKLLLQVPNFKFLGLCINHFLPLGKRFKPLSLNFLDEDYALFCRALESHFCGRWLNLKKKSHQKKTIERHPDGKHAGKNGKLQTVPEHFEMPETTYECQERALFIEWTYQRLPLPVHWLLSPLCTASNSEAAEPRLSSNVKHGEANCSGNPIEVVKGGLLFLLGLEAMSYFLSMRCFNLPIGHIPLVWNFHALSAMLISRTDVLDDERFRDIFENLQMLYGQRLEESILKDMKLSRKFLFQFLDANGSCEHDGLAFQKQIHESYNTFIEILVEHFASISYGDVIFGRQVAIYLHRSAEISVRLAAWNALSNCHVLELLPPLGECISNATGYLEPVEDDGAMLEAYVKSWTSGALDRAAQRGSMSFSLSLHHLSQFVFRECAYDKLLLRNRLIKSLLRGLSRKPNLAPMMMDFIKYKELSIHDLQVKFMFVGEEELLRRFAVLSDACEGNSSLLAGLEKLKQSLAT